MRRTLPIILAAMAVVAVVVVLVTGGDEDAAPAAGDRSAPAATAPVATTAEPEPALSGRVVRRGSGDGIGAALVRVTCAEDRFEATTEEDGYYAVDPLPAGPCEVAAEAAGFTAGGPTAARPIAVRIRPDEALADVDLPLYEEAIVTGRVRVGDAPAAGARLSVLYVEAPDEPEPFTLSIDTPTDERGGFRLEGLGPGRVQILVEHEEFALAESDELFLHAADRVDDIVITLASGGRVAGRVVDDAGRPVADATVRLRAGHASVPREARTGASGTFAFEGVAPGEVRVSARAPGYRLRERVEGAVEAGDELAVELVLEGLDGFSGLVVDPRGTPAGDAAIYVFTQRVDATAIDPQRTRPVTWSDADGRFWVEAPPAGGGFVLASHAAWAASEPAPTPGRGGQVTLRLGVGGSLVGRVVDERGQRVARYTISARARPVSQRGGSRRLRIADPSGEFAFLGLAPGRYILTVVAPGYAPTDSAVQVVVAGRETHVGDIQLEIGGAVVGRIVDAVSGRPIPNALVRSPGWIRQGARADADGRFRLEGLPTTDRITVSAFARGYMRRLESGLEIASGGVTDVGSLALTPVQPGGERRMQYSGIGAVLQRQGDRLLVQNAFADAPAAQSGLEAGTQILSINGLEVGELDLREAVEMIRGEAGTDLTLEVVVPGGQYPEVVHVERGQVTTPR